MTDSSNDKCYFKSAKEVLDYLISALQEKKAELGAGNAVIKTNGRSSISIHLHNKEKRPTVYQIELKFNRETYSRSFISNLVIDTIVNECKDKHVSLKESSPYLNFIKNKVVELLSQPSDGTPEETEKNYTCLGLLYRKNDIV